MKITVEEKDSQRELEVIIRCKEVDNEVVELLGRLKSGKKVLSATDDKGIYRISLDEIFYFETVDNRSYIYGQNKVYESKLKLYEFEELVQGTNFFRTSKSIVLNSDKIIYIKAALSGRFEAHLENGEKVMVSRQFVPDLKKALGM